MLISTRVVTAMQRRTAAMKRHWVYSLMVLAPLIAGSLALPFAAAQQSEMRAQTTNAQNDLRQNFLIQHQIGQRFQIEPSDLPAPKTSPIVTNRSLIVPYNGQVPQVPPGFTATPFATGLVNPRRVLVLPNGEILVAEQSARS